MDTVFILWHCHDADGDIDEKLIGVYRTREDAQAAIGRLEDKPGFTDARDGFQIHEYVIGRDGWSEGYISAADAAENSER